jgi:cyclophilin family peptidyl-prolyl cis-trans isomerase
VESLGSHLSGEARERLHGYLADEDNGKRLSAVMALRRLPAASDMAPLMRAFETSTGGVSSEIAFNVLQNLGAIGGDESERFLLSKVDDPRPYVADVAREVLQEKFGLKIDWPEHLPPVSEEPIPLAGQEFPAWTENPIVEINTSRGTMTFELFPGEATLHVHNFLKLVEQEHYHGTTFHRVVPDFVVQGGDERGDGNGATPWRGDGIRHEFTPRAYERGALGMPRNADPDSGGSQFFITHRPTPHLDGRYTVFGMLRGGGEVLDRIEVGDRILEIRVLP